MKLIEAINMNDIINNESLIKEGWELNSCGNNLYYVKTIKLSNRVFHCEILPYSNTPNRDYYVHVDNEDFKSVGSMDVSKFSQIYQFLNLL